MNTAIFMIIFGYAAALGVWCGQAFAQEASSSQKSRNLNAPPRDSAANARRWLLFPKNIPSITVSASRITSSAQRISAPATLLDAAAIQTLGARQIADVLNFVPGVMVRNYGGMSGLKTVSLRGASASQTAVLLDGVRLQSTQSGQFDFSTLPSAMVEEIEVVRGGGAAIFGGNAMGGAVNIRTKSSVAKPEAFLEADVASFQEFRAAASGAAPFDLFGNGKGGIFAGGEYQTARGNYPFAFNDFGQNLTLERMNADFRNIVGNALLSAQSQRVHLQTRILVRSSERGTPGAVVQGNVEMAQARLAEDDVLVSLKTSYVPAAQVLFTLLASGKWNTLHFRDPEARQFSVNGLNERFLGQDFSLSGRLRFDETTNLSDVDVAHEWLLEHNVSTLRGNMLQPGIGNFVERINTAVSGKGDVSWRAFGLRVLSNAAVRLDVFSDVGAAISPLVGSALVLDSSWKVRVEWNYNFRPPAFNELYYLNFGNSRLKPERAMCANIGATYSDESTVFGEIVHGQMRINASVDGFFHKTENQILAVQTTPFTVSAQNIAAAESYGLETSFQALLQAESRRASLTLNYTFQRATNQTEGGFAQGKLLIYTPEHLASGVVTFSEVFSREVRLESGLTGQFVGNRYALPSNTAESVLPAFLVLGAFCETTLALGGTDVTVRLQGDNLGDERYAVIRNFPMPGRSVRLGLKAVVR